jgi:hypothetical protein
MIVRRLTAFVLLCTLLPLTACTSMKTIHPATSPGAPTYGRLKAGDTVIVHTLDGQQRRFVVRQIDGDTIIGPGGERYTRAEVVRLQRKSFSLPKTVALVAGVWVGVIIVLVAAAAGQLADNIG